MDNHRVLYVRRTRLKTVVFLMTRINAFNASFLHFDLILNKKRNIRNNV